MKKLYGILGIILMMTMVLSVGVLAEYSTNEQTTTCGKYKWVSDGVPSWDDWKIGKWSTAVFNQGIYSNDAGSSLTWVHQTNSGDWKTDIYNDFSARDTTEYGAHTDFTMWTVNTPLKTELTPGDWGLANEWMSQFVYTENVVTKFLNSQIDFAGKIGEGTSRIISDWHLMTGTDNRVDQTTILQVNPQLS